MDESLERLIAEHLARGDHAGAATLAIQRMGPQILAFLGAHMRNDDAAYEVFSAFCEQLWKSIPTFRGESSFKTWAYKLVMHGVSRYRRDGFRRRGQHLETADAVALADEVRSSTPAHQRTEVKDQITRLRESMDPEDQTLLFLRIDQALSWNDIAAILSEQGEPVEAATLRKRFERAKLRLRKLAEEQGIIAPAADDN